MSALRFKPWVRKNAYGKLLGKRVLILGEAHYQRGESGKQHPGLTVELIENQITGRGKYAFWTRIVGAFLGHKPNSDEKRDFWPTVAFSNCIQEFAGTGPRIPPSPEMWARGELAFAELLERLKPQAVIVLGYRLWNHLRNIDHVPDFIMDDPKSLQTRRYAITGGGSALAYAIRHPSSGFNGAKWTPYIRKAIHGA